MVALQIRDVPEDVRDTLAVQAKARGQSLPAYLLELVETQARRLSNAAVLDRFADRSDGTRSLPGETSAEVADQAGAARDREPCDVIVVDASVVALRTLVIDRVEAAKLVAGCGNCEATSLRMMPPTLLPPRFLPARLSQATVHSRRRTACAARSG